MKILSIGFPLPGAALDNFTFLNAPSFFDYDAIVVDPRSISQVVDDVAAEAIEHHTFSGERIVNHTEGPGYVSLSEVLHNRADEAAKLLTRGRLIVCLAVPNANHSNITGLADFSRYAWLPLPTQLKYEAPFVTRGGGAQFTPIENDYPFGVFLKRIAARLSYQVYFDDALVPPDGQVLARSVGGAPVAVSVAAGGGRVILLPPPTRGLTSQSRYEASEALQQAVRQELRLASASLAPHWVARLDLPGLDPLLEEQTALAARSQGLQQNVAENRGAIEELQLYQKLLWEDGRELEAAVRSSLILLGFGVIPEDLDQAAMVQDHAKRFDSGAFLEVDGSEDVVGLDVHFRLRGRLEGTLASEGPKQGIIVVNGFRRTPPEERPQQFSDELMRAAQRMRYCLVTGGQLFRAVQAHLREDRETSGHFCELLLTSEGVLAED